MEIHLKDVIDQLKKELREAMGDDPMFYVASANVTAKITIQESETQNGSLEIFVLKAGGQLQNGRETGHEISIELKPIGGDRLSVGSFRTDGSIG